ncbi:HNH endonuclease [Variovorax sp. LG9.2]|uniref:HNH endonuclease n=1 Tax=Variovorax sp. LG9.2 TaxID=3048626 RepID=UPI002B2229C8|nr:HNH endonuclease [Variovorax sp. LG9.2]
MSKILRGLVIHPASSRVGSFRNPDGVSFKLQNIKQVASGKGLANVSRIDREVWAAYGDKPGEVKQIATAILAVASLNSLSDDKAEIEDVFPEGGVLTAVHHRRERSPKLRKALLSKRAKTGRVCCDACGWIPLNGDERLALAAFEAHHLLPLAKAGESKTKLDDVALLCANCHRLVHRWISVTGEWLNAYKIKSLIVNSANINKAGSVAVGVGDRFHESGY